MTKWLVLTAAVLIAASSLAPAADKQPAQKLLDSAHSPADLFQHAASPFDLEVDFTIHATKSIPGHLSLKWQSKDHWWRKFTLGSFDEYTILDGENRYTWGAFTYTPERVDQFFHLLYLEGSVPALEAQKLKNRSLDGVEMSCISGRNIRDSSSKVSYELCLDARTNDISSIETKQFLPAKGAEVFAGYFDFEGQRFPRQFEKYENNTLVISANVVSLKESPFDVALLTPPQGATHRRVCPGELPPKVISTVFPKLAPLSNGPSGVAVHLTVQTDGSVSGVQLINTNDPRLGAPVTAAFERWKFKPATCDGEPVVADITTYLTLSR